MIENIDIGGPTMIRAAAKNFAFSAVVVNPASYDAIVAELTRCRRQALAGHARGPGGRGVLLHRPLRQRDLTLVPAEAGRLPEPAADRLREGDRPPLRRERPPARRVLRRVRARGCTCSRWSASTAARSCRSTTCWTSTPRACSRRSSSSRACVIIKHNNPCGVAVGGSIVEAYHAAFACDPLSAFGGVICVNRTVDVAVRRGAAEAVLRGHHRPGVHRRGARAPGHQAEHARARGRRAARAPTSPSATSSG